MKLAYLPFELRLKQTFRIARSSSDTRNVILIKIAASENEFAQNFRHGLGEVIPYAYYGQTHELAVSLMPRIAKFLENKNPPQSLDEVQELTAELAKVLCDEGLAPKTIKHLESAVSGALMDLAAKLRGISLMELLKSNLAPAEQRSLRFPLTSYTLGIDTPERMKEKALEAAEFQILKIKLGQSLQEDLANMRAVRSCSQTLLRVDANCGWNLETAVQMSRELENMNVEFVEQPMPPNNIEGHTALKSQTKIPIVLDESILEMSDIEANRSACHGVNLKFSKSGGLLPCLQMIRKARECNLKVMLGSMIETSVGIGFAYHLSALVDFADLDGNVLTANDPYATQGNITIQKGRITEVAQRPGLGITDSHTQPWITP
jgi:L-alanine-DL-glutamate epimerase-like enolase superfamily enzyme